MVEEGWVRGGRCRVLSKRVDGCSGCRASMTLLECVEWTVARPPVRNFDRR